MPKFVSDSTHMMTATIYPDTERAMVQEPFLSFWLPLRLQYFY